MTWADAELRALYQPLTTADLAKRLAWIEEALERLKVRVRVLKAMLAERAKGGDKDAR